MVDDSKEELVRQQLRSMVNVNLEERTGKMKRKGKQWKLRKLVRLKEGVEVRELLCGVMRLADKDKSLDLTWR